MKLASIKFFLCRNDVQIIIICTVTGGILQIISKNYLKNHPEFLKPGTKNKYRLPKFLSPRGGAIIEISAVSFKFAAKVAINFLAKQGLMAGLLTGSSIVISKIPLTAVSTYIRDALPQNLPDLEKKKFILIDGDKIYLDQCDSNLEYLFKVLEDPSLSFKEKEELARKILTKHLDLRTPSGRLNFTLCIVFVLYILSSQNLSSFYIMMKNLIKAIQEGRISKRIGRLIVRKLKKKGIVVDPGLIDAVTE